MNTTGKIFTLISLLGLMACQSPTKPLDESPTSNNSDHLTAAVLWFQKGETARLACEQSFDYAKRLLLEKIAGRDSLSKLAVVLDLDETVVDNSPYEARVIQDGKSYEPESWALWVKEANADAIPGALDFLHFADSIGVSLFYVSNRRHENRAFTLQNLLALGVPQADSNTVLLRKEVSDKSARRAQVAEKHEIALLIGDQTGDFAQDFASAERQLKGKIVVIPNPMYGEFTRLPDSIKSAYPSLGEALKTQLNSKR